MTDGRRVAFYGLGQLGLPICRALGASPHRVRAYDPRAAAIDGLDGSGVVAATSVADAADGADVAIVIVRDDAQVRDVLLGHGGALAALREGAIVALHSTVAPATVREVHAACLARGVRFADVGISTGSARPMGSYYAMCGGDLSTIDELRPVVAVYCSDVVRFGAVGAGMAAKLVRNAMRYTAWAVMYEGFVLAEAAGLDLGAMAHLYRGTFGTSPDDEMVLQRATMAALDPATDPSAAEYVARMIPTVTLAWKDLDDAYHLADELGVDVAMARAARARFGPAIGLALRDETDLDR